MVDKRGLLQLKKLLSFEINKSRFIIPSRPREYSKIWAVPQKRLLKEASERLHMMPHLSSSISSNDTSDATCSEDNIVWIDMEMTGLEVEKDHILEVACLVTDSKLNVIAVGPNLVIHQPDEVLKNMNEWSLKQHEESGLTSKCKESKISIKEAESELLNFVRAWTPYKKCPLGGNSVYFDRYFLAKHMPEFEQHMLYRIVDVSSIKELCRRWYPEIYNEQPNKKLLSKHRAMEDIKASIEELKFYKANIFRKPEMAESMTNVTWY